MLTLQIRISYAVYVGEHNSSLQPPVCLSSCSMPFVEPTTTRTCSHTFCRDCINQALKTSPQCPIDRSPLQDDDLLAASPIVRHVSARSLHQAEFARTNIRIARGRVDCGMPSSSRRMRFHVSETAPRVSPTRLVS